MRLVIATTQVPFVRGGAEVHAENLCRVLRDAGHQTEIVAIPFKAYPPERILDAMLACRLLDLEEANGTPIDRLIGLKFPAYMIPHHDKVLWILHQHRSAYDQWNHAFDNLDAAPNAQEVRAAIQQADHRIIREAKRVYANSQNVAARLAQYSRIESKPLYHPPFNAEKFYSGAAENFLLFPSRIDRLKRQALALEALALTSAAIDLVICGEAEQSSFLDELKRKTEALNLSGRVHFTGQVSEPEKLSLYARSLGVLYPPFDEDYGYVTLEAMLARKPVLTCTDSGGPLEFVVDQVTGLIAPPEAKALARIIDQLVADKAAATRMGAAGWERYHALEISWEHVVSELTA